jgi:2-polyprenyl-3-methyl-5-hydroxy-6-metoxy-1,4-benzoquinol methylase
VIKVTDEKQNQIEDFIVPDKSRITKGINMIRSKLSKDSVCLDIGISIDGFGDSIQKEFNATVYGIDIHKRNMSNMETMKHDINLGLPYKNQFYNIITAGEVIEHLYNDEEFLKECHRCLKPDGTLLITTPNIHFLVNRISGLFGVMPMFTYCSFHYNIYNKEELVKKIERNGFKVTNIKGSHILCSSRRHPIGKFFEYLAELFPTFAAHLIVVAEKVDESGESH